MTTDWTDARVAVAAPTEERNPATAELDLMPTRQALDVIHDEDRRVMPAVAAVLPALARLVDEALERVRHGGIVHYFGAGTSGRLGVLDAAELPPTYGVRGIVVAHHAGGSDALVTARENVEDRADDGVLAAGDLTDRDVAIGLTASGRTPFVAGAMAAARSAGALTAVITSHPRPEVAGPGDIVLVADTGPEVITGSTRMKAGTATKLILNAFSTMLMVKLGHTYSNLMISMRPTNAKLRGRAVRMLVEATGEGDATCSSALEAAGDIPTALVVLLSGAGCDEASLRRCRAALARASGRVRDALRDLAGH